MNNIITMTAGCMVVCMSAIASGKSGTVRVGSSMQATVDKAAAALMQTEQEEIRAGHDSAAGEACSQLYDLDNSKNIEWLVKAGDAFTRAGKNDRARTMYERYLDKKSSSPQVIAKLATVELARQNFARVVDLVKQIPQIVSSQESMVVIAAESYYAVGAFDEVLSLLPAIKLHKNRRGLELAAQSSEKMGDFKTALSLYEKLLPASAAAKRQELSFCIAALLEKMNAKDKAMKAYEANIAEYPSDLRSYERLTRLYMTDCQWRQAQVLLEKALALADARPYMARMLGQCLAAQANRLAAVNQYRHYLALVPGDSAAWCELGSVYYEQEHYSDAIEVLKKSVALMPKNAECLTLLGECLAKSGDIRGAVEPLEQSRVLAKSDIRVLSQLAECYKALNDRKKLMSVLKDWTAFDPRNGQAQCQLAEMYAKDGKWRDVIFTAENAFNIDSTNAQAHLLYAQACEKTMNENGRYIHLRKAYQYAPDNAEVLYELGAYYSGRNQIVAARPLLAKAISIDQMHAGAHFEYARLLKAGGERDSAYWHFNTAAQLDPFNITYLVQFAQAAYAMGKRDVAFDYIKKALSRDSMQFDVLQWAGIMYKDAGYADTAKALLLKAIVRNAHCASCDMYLADIYYDNGEYDLAVKFYTQSLSIGSYSEAASVKLGNALIMSGDFERARMMFEKIFSTNTKSEEVLYRLCSVCLRMGNIDKAKSLFTQYAGTRTGGWTHLTRGEIAEAEGRAPDALVSFTVASTLMPENPLAHAGVGRIELMKKEYDKAVESFGRALGNAPHNVDFLIGTGKAYEGIGQFSAAFDLYAEVARRSPRQPDVFGLMGRVLSLQQLHDQAIATFKRGLELNPKNAELAYGLGHELRVMMQFGDAIEAYKKSVRTRSDEKRFFSAYKDIGDIYFYDLKNPEKAKDYYKKYMKSGGKDEAVVSMVNGLKM
jgi:tetratricopeptide (TPR) repeat protein